MHGNDERVSITGLEQGTGMLTRVLRQTIECAGRRSSAVNSTPMAFCAGASGVSLPPPAG